MEGGRGKKENAAVGARARARRTGRTVSPFSYSRSSYFRFPRRNANFFLTQSSRIARPTGLGWDSAVTGKTASRWLASRLADFDTVVLCRICEFRCTKCNFSILTISRSGKCDRPWLIPLTQWNSSFRGDYSLPVSINQHSV